MDASFPNRILFFGVITGWTILGLSIIVNRFRARRGEAQKRDRTSLIGLAVQAVAFFAVFSSRHPRPVANAWIAGSASFLAVASGIFGAAAIQTLGRQWSLLARLTDEHRLITSGPYRVVRHPIYTSMLGLLIASGICFSTPWVTVAAVVVYVIGTILRIRSEEGLLVGVFGDTYSDYARRVGAFIPKISARGSAR